jgi:prolyl-tRNA synthetase
MGCYGIGVSRLMQACVEQRHVEAKYPDWPLEIAPFQVAIVPAKRGSGLDDKCLKLVPYLYDMLDKLAEFKDDVLIDDRVSLTIGRRVLEAKLIGVPLAVVLGKSIEGEEVEIVVVSESMKRELGKERVFCHSRELAHVIRQIKNDFAYKLKMKKLMRESSLAE